MRRGTCNLTSMDIAFVNWNLLAFTENTQSPEGLIIGCDSGAVLYRA
jgi:hypothetical protein